MTPWEVLCVDLIGPYTLKGKDGSQIDFICLTMIDPASSWFEIVELPVMETITPVEINSRRKKVHKNIITKETYFDKTSTMISHLVNKTWFSRYPHCRNFTSKLYVIHMALSVSLPVSKTLKRMLYWNVCIKFS